MPSRPPSWPLPSAVVVASFVLVAMAAVAGAAPAGPPRHAVVALEGAAPSVPPRHALVAGSPTAHGWTAPPDSTVARAAAASTSGVDVAASVSVAGSGAAATSVGVTRPPSPAVTRGRGARWAWPLTPRPRLLQAYRAPPQPWAPGHRGVDLAATSGQVVGAVDAGVVTHAGVIAGRGTVTVLHASGLRSTYEPVAASVARGDRLARGQPLGRVTGASHCGGACLHLGALLARDYRDPWPLLVGGPVRLLPLRAR